MKEQQMCKSEAEKHEVSQEPVGALTLGGIIDTSDGLEYEGWDVEWDTKVIEALQEKLVTSDSVEVMLYTHPQPKKGFRAVNAVHEGQQCYVLDETAQAEAEKQEPAAWQWLTTAHFRKKLPKDAEKGAWNPLYTHPQPKREPLLVFAKECVLGAYRESELADAAQRAIEAAHGIKE
jgi:hypothetical protein